MRNPGSASHRPAALHERWGVLHKPPRSIDRSKEYVHPGQQQYLLISLRPLILAGRKGKLLGLMTSSLGRWPAPSNLLGTNGFAVEDYCSRAGAAFAPVADATACNPR